MGTSVLHRSWVSPLTAISFIVVAVTGILMVFHVRLPGIHGAHQWMGVVFALAGLLHLALNWRSLLACCRSKAAAVALALGLVTLVVAVTLPGHDGDHGDRPRGGQRFGHGRR